MPETIAVVGSINADLTVRVRRHPVPGETLVGVGGGITGGGKGANQAVAAARLGARVSMIGAVGADANAAPATTNLRNAGVDLSGVRETDEVTGLSVITVADGGENTITFIPGANALVTDDEVAAHADLLADADVLLLQGEIPASGFRKATELARGRVVVNLAPVIEVDRAALLRADPIMANEHEAGLILAQFGVDVAHNDPHTLARELLQVGFRSVVLTLGGSGALVADGAELVDIPTPAVTAVDTTGAGDAFAGAFAAQLVTGAQLVDAARYAARVGAFAVTGHGAQDSYPDSSSVLPE